MSGGLGHHLGSGGFALRGGAECQPGSAGDGLG